jgi:hypothetical protein
MEPIKCLLLFAAVLSFAAMNAAYNPLPDDRVNDCDLWNGKDKMGCFGCCKLLYRKLNNGRMYKMSDAAWNDGQCVCSYDVGEGFPTPEQIARYDSYINGNREIASDSSRRAIPGVSITKID